MAKQLNIRSDEAYSIAHEIAERTHLPVAEVVVKALRDYGNKLPKVDDLTPTQKADFEALRALAKRAARRKKPGATSDHSDMYDEFGLPI